MSDRLLISAIPALAKQECNRLALQSRTIALSLTKNQPERLFAQVSDCDLARVQGKWYPKRIGNRIYAARTLTLHWEGREQRGKFVLLHRFLLDAPKGARVIFKDGNGLNCTRENLVLVPKKKRKTVRKKLSRTARLRRLRRETGY